MKCLVLVILILGCTPSRAPVQLNTAGSEPSVVIQVDTGPSIKKTSKPCWDEGNRPCFVIDVSAPERIVAGWRKMSFYGAKHSVVDPSKDPVGTVKEAYDHLNQNDDPNPAEYGTVLIGPGSNQEVVDLVAGWLEQAGMEGTRVSKEGFPNDEALTKAQELPEVALSMAPEYTDVYLSEFKNKELAMRACFMEANYDQGPLVCKFDIGEDGLVRNVYFKSALPDPVPTMPYCSEYDEHRGICEREDLVYPDEFLEDPVLECLGNALRSARFAADQAREDVVLNISGPAPPVVEYDDMPWQREN